MIFDVTTSWKVSTAADFIAQHSDLTARLAVSDFLQFI